MYLQYIAEERYLYLLKICTFHNAAYCPGTCNTMHVIGGEE